MRARRLICAVSVVVVFASVLLLGSRSAPLATPKQSPPREWPMFGGTLARNMVNPSARNLPAEWDVEETKKNLKWVADLGSKTYRGPAIADGRIFLGTNNQKPRDPKLVDAKGNPIDHGVMMCFRASDGKFLWQAAHPRLAAGPVNDWPLEAIASVPTVEGDRLYYVSNRAELICARTDDGSVVWKLDMIRELGVYPHNLAVCSPLIAEDHVFVVTGNGVDEGHLEIPAPQAPSFIAVSKHNGKVAWQSNAPTASMPPPVPGVGREKAMLDLRNRGELLLHAQWSNPAYAETDGVRQVVFPGGDGWLYAFEPRTGKLLWKFDGNPKNSVYSLGGKGTRNEFIGTPAAHDGRLYIGVGQDPENQTGVGHLWCIDLAKALSKGRVNKDHDVSPSNDDFDPASPANKDSALAWHFGGANTSEVRKKTGHHYRFGRTMSTCAVHDGLVYAADLEGILHCLDSRTGTLYWTHATDATTWSSPYVADGKIYLGNDEGVFVFAHGNEKRLLATIEMGERIRGGIVAVDEVLYIAGEHKLYALSLPR